MLKSSSIQANTVAEAFTAYLSGQSKPRPHKSSTKGMTFDQLFSDRMLIIRTIREGIPNALFMSIKALAPFTEQDWSDFLDISLKSLQRYKKDKDHVFKSIHSEKIIELAEVTATGQNVFDTNDQFHTWLNTPSQALGGLMPLELLKDSYGKEMVLNELQRIDQGIFV